MSHVRFVSQCAVVLVEGEIRGLVQFSVAIDMHPMPPTAVPATWKHLSTVLCTYTVQPYFVHDVFPFAARRRARGNERDWLDGLLSTMGVMLHSCTAA